MRLSWRQTALHVPASGRCHPSGQVVAAAAAPWGCPEEPRAADRRVGAPSDACAALPSAWAVLASLAELDPKRMLGRAPHTLDAPALRSCTPGARSAPRPDPQGRSSAAMGAAGCAVQLVCRAEPGRVEPAQGRQGAHCACQPSGDCIAHLAKLSEAHVQPAPTPGQAGVHRPPLLRPRLDQWLQPTCASRVCCLWMPGGRGVLTWHARLWWGALQVTDEAAWTSCTRWGGCNLAPGPPTGSCRCQMPEN